MNEISKSSENLPVVYSADQIDLKELILCLINNKWIVVLSGLFALVISIIIALLLPNIYKSDTLLAPTSSDSSSLSDLASKFGGLASLASVSIPSSADNKTVLGIQVLKSRKFFEQFIQHPDVLLQLMAVENWYSSTGEIIIDADIYDITNEHWVRDATTPRNPKPSVLESHVASINNVKRVNENQETRFHTFSVFASINNFDDSYV